MILIELLRKKFGGVHSETSRMYMQCRMYMLAELVGSSSHIKAINNSLMQKGIERIKAWTNRFISTAIRILCFGHVFSLRRALSRFLSTRWRRRLDWYDVGGFVRAPSLARVETIIGNSIKIEQALAVSPGRRNAAACQWTARVHASRSILDLILLRVHVYINKKNMRTEVPWPTPRARTVLVLSWDINCIYPISDGKNLDLPKVEIRKIL